MSSSFKLDLPFEPAQIWFIPDKKVKFIGVVCMRGLVIRNIVREASSLM